MLNPDRHSPRQRIEPPPVESTSPQFMPACHPHPPTRTRAGVGTVSRGGQNTVKLGSIGDRRNVHRLACGHHGAQVNVMIMQAGNQRAAVPVQDILTWPDRKLVAYLLDPTRPDPDVQSGPAAHGHVLDHEGFHGGSTWRSAP